MVIVTLVMTVLHGKNNANTLVVGSGKDYNTGFVKFSNVLVRCP